MTTALIVAAALAVTLAMTTRALSRRWDWRLAATLAVTWAAWLAWQAVGRGNPIALTADAALMSWWACVAWALRPVPGAAS